MRVQVLLHLVAKAWIEDSWGVREGGSGCWALLSWKSPKFRALLVVLVLCVVYMKGHYCAGMYSLKSPVCLEMC